MGFAFFLVILPKIKLMNMKKIILLLLMTAAMALPADAQKYHVTNTTRTRILIDDKFAQDAEAVKYLEPYKHVVDSIMSPIVGETAKFMKAYSPESELSNLLADIMVWCGKKYNETPELGIYNMGGIRAALPAGKVTFGDVLDVAPFENKICFLTLTGEQLTTLFQQICKANGAGISHGWEVIVKGKELKSLKYQNEAIDPQRKYRVATIDYLIDGNDGFKEFMNATDINSPKDEMSNTRFLITDYFRAMYAEGKIVDSNIEGRVVME